LFGRFVATMGNPATPAKPPNRAPLVGESSCLWPVRGRLDGARHGVRIPSLTAFWRTKLIQLEWDGGFGGWNGVSQGGTELGLKLRPNALERRQVRTQAQAKANRTR